MIALDDPGAWAHQALTRVRDWMGSGIPTPGAPTVHQRKSKLTKALELAAVQLAEKWDARFMEAAYGLLDHPGRRLALAEAALTRFIGYCNDAAAAHADRLRQQAPRAQSGRTAAAIRPGQLHGGQRLQLVRQPVAAEVASVHGPPRRLRPPVPGRRPRRRGRPVLRRPVRPTGRPPARPDLVPAAPAAHTGRPPRRGERRGRERKRRRRGVAAVAGRNAVLAGPQPGAGPVHRGVLGGGARVGHAPRRSAGGRGAAGDGGEPLPRQPQQRTLVPPRPDRCRTTFWPRAKACSRRA